MTELLYRKHEAFARDVGLFGVEPLEAFVRAGFKRNAGNATRLLHRPEVDARIRELSRVAMAKAAEIAGVDRGRALAETALLAYSNVLDFIEIRKGKAMIKSLADIPREKAAAIQSIGYDAKGNIKIKLHDKVSALSTLLKYTDEQPSVPKQTELQLQRESVTADEGWDELTEPREKPSSPLN